MHTPGPWKWVEGVKGFEEGALSKLVGEDGKEVCNFGEAVQYYPTEGVEPSEADAALISAAPELLQALKAEHWQETCRAGVGCPACRAINKAEGK